MVEVCHKVWNVVECAVSEKRLRNTYFRKCCEDNFICDRLRKSYTTVE